MRLYRLFGPIVLGVFLTLSGCSSEGSSGPVPDPEPDPVADPVAATLVFPEDDTECNEGEVIDEEQSRVTFIWNESENTDSYELVLLDLGTDQEERYASSTDELGVTLSRATPYEWYVVSKAEGSNVTAESQRWRFYNEGPGVESHAPFPAEAVSPVRGSTVETTTGTVVLEWIASDVDDDIVGYEVFFGTDADPVSMGTTTESSMEVESVVSGTTYYWKVVTEDSKGNSSTSEVFEFKIG